MLCSARCSCFLCRELQSCRAADARKPPAKMCDNFILKKAEAWEPMKFIRGAARLSVRHWQSREPLAPAKSRVAPNKSTSCEQLYPQPKEDVGPYAMRKAPSSDRVKQTEHKSVFKILGNSRKKADIPDSNVRRSVLNFRRNEPPGSKNVHEKYIPLPRATSPPEHIYSEPKPWNSQYDDCCRPPIYQSVEKKIAAKEAAADKKIYSNRPPCYDELAERLSHEKTRKVNIPSDGGLANKITQNNNKVVIYFGDSIIRKHSEQKKEDNKQKEIIPPKEEAIYVNRQSIESENLAPNKDVDKGGGTQLVSEIEIPEAVYSEIKSPGPKEESELVNFSDATYKKDIFESVSPDGFLVVEFEGNFERARQLVELVHGGGRAEHNEATVLDEDELCDWSFIQDWRKR
ncbi:jg11433 [Pararge aegeria aegeria]|uniref:Jg11433 protein n=1 Tax=Pararge aegeria aegeria TaxID=348720 RepID=A0A8S4RZV1_9NEOP|nr:jg11433 [Pararge aegeria aegeria]